MKLYQTVASAVVAMAMCVSLAIAQAPPSPPPSAIISSAGLSIHVTGTSARQALTTPTTFPVALLINIGSNEVFWVAGSSSAVATTGGIPLEPGSCVAAFVGAATNIAAITAGGGATSTLRIIQANGQPGFSCASQSANSFGLLLGNAAAPFGATASDQAVTGLTLPGKVRFIFPAQAIGTTSPNIGQLQINYNGGNACTAPGGALGPGQIDDWIYISSITAPHVCLTTGTASVVVQQ